MTNTEPRKCPHCGKKLRRHNTKGICGKCQSNGKAPMPENAPAAKARRDEAPPETEKKPARKGRLVRPDADTVNERVERFLQLSTLLGVDGAGLLIEFIDGWVGQVREKAASLVEEA